MSNPWITGYSYGECRLIGHAWHVVPSDWKAEIGHPMTLRCERCNTERRIQFGVNTGEVVSSRYIYPDRYEFRRETDTDVLPNRNDFRLAWLEDEVAKVRQARRKVQRKQRKVGT